MNKKKAQTDDWFSNWNKVIKDVFGDDDKNQKDKNEAEGFDEWAEELQNSKMDLIELLQAHMELVKENKQLKEKAQMNTEELNTVKNILSELVEVIEEIEERTVKKPSENFTMTPIKRKIMDIKSHIKQFEEF